MNYDPGTEAEALDTYSDDDFTSSETEVEKMCRYHDIGADDLYTLSNNAIKDMWLTYRKFGKCKE